MASPLKDLPRERILTIIAAPARHDLANILEQGLKIGGQRIAGAMQMPHHLIEIISEPRQAARKSAVQHCCRFLFCGIDFAIFIEKQRAPEMNRAHADRLGALLDALQLARGETKIELLVARFG